MLLNAVCHLGAKKIKLKTGYRHFLYQHAKGLPVRPNSDIRVSKKGPVRPNSDLGYPGGYFEVPNEVPKYRVLLKYPWVLMKYRPVLHEVPKYRRYFKGKLKYRGYFGTSEVPKNGYFGYFKCRILAKAGGRVRTTRPPVTALCQATTPCTPLLKPS